MADYDEETCTHLNKLLDRSSTSEDRKNRNGEMIFLHEPDEIGFVASFPLDDILERGSHVRVGGILRVQMAQTTPFLNNLLPTSGGIIGICGIGYAQGGDHAH